MLPIGDSYLPVYAIPNPVLDDDGEFGCPFDMLEFAQDRSG